MPNNVHLTDQHPMSQVPTTQIRKSPETTNSTRTAYNNNKNNSQSPPSPPLDKQTSTSNTSMAREDNKQGNQASYADRRTRKHVCIHLSVFVRLSNRRRRIERALCSPLVRDDTVRYGIPLPGILHASRRFLCAREVI